MGMTSDLYIKARLAILRILAVLAMVIIALKLWQLQVMSSSDYQRSADLNRYRLIPIDAPRGIIYDRFGKLLVRNIPSFTVSIVPAGLPEASEERARVLGRVGELLGMPVTAPVAPQYIDMPDTYAGAAFNEPGIEEILVERMTNAYTPVLISSKVDRQAAFVLAEESLKLPGVLVEAQPLRQYMDGSLTAHILGYVGRIPSESVNEYVADEEGAYQPDDMVGLTGIEMAEEELLRGTKGEKHVEVDAFEREVAVVASRPAVQGHNLMLTIDLTLQQTVEDALREGMATTGSKAGVVIAMDPRTGEILAMVSLPSYDNNLFSGGISYEDYDRLSSDVSHPLVNHAISGQYPPGSTFKIVTAGAALQEQVIDRSTTRSCGGILLLPNKYYPGDSSKAQPFYCWNRGGHGALTITGAIAWSCDIFFYQVAGGYEGFVGLGMDRLARYARMYGYGEPTGIGLPGEVSGLIPDDRWKRLALGEMWLTGDTYNAAIGQGYVLATPLQVLNATAAVANRGTLYRPQLVYQVTDPQGQVVRALTPEPIRKLDISQENLELVRRGMLEVVASGGAPGGRVPGIAVAGKTGTAEYAGVDEEGKLIRDTLGRLSTHAWYTAFAPYEDPEIALVVFLDAGVGATHAAPVAAKIMRAYFGLVAPKPMPTAVPPTPAP
jgi:penicillin-binding protein 2